MKICFISYGSEQIGYGHIMRCMTLANCFVDLHQDVFFISKYTKGTELLKEEGFDIRKIGSEVSESTIGIDNNSDYAQVLETEIIPILRVEKPECVIIDDYNVDADFFKLIHIYTKFIAYIDDLNAFDYPVDMIINGTASAFNMDYKIIKDRILLLGMKYNLLRKEFQKITHKPIKNKINAVLITTGGSDSHHMTQIIANFLLSDEYTAKMKIHIIIGGAFTEELSLYDLGKLDNVFIYKSPKQMSAIMLKCDIAITAGGSTLYELMACGIPTISFIYAENQTPQVKALEKEKLLLNLGWYNELDGDLLISQIRKLEDYKMRKQVSESGINNLDGQGAMRCAKKILSIFNP